MKNLYKINSCKQILRHVVRILFEKSGRRTYIEETWILVKLNGRASIKFIGRLEWKNKEITEALQILYEFHVPEEWSIHRLITRIKKGWDNVEDEVHSCRPFTSICEEKLNLICPNRRWLMVNSSNNSKYRRHVNWLSYHSTEWKLQLRKLSDQ